LLEFLAVAHRLQGGKAEAFSRWWAKNRKSITVISLTADLIRYYCINLTNNVQVYVKKSTSRNG
jgi:hypothetical protein